jgi:hypothetical protein
MEEVLRRAEDALKKGRAASTHTPSTAAKKKKKGKTDSP